MADDLAGLVNAKGVHGGEPGALVGVVELGGGDRVDAAGEVRDVAHPGGHNLLVVVDQAVGFIAAVAVARGLALAVSDPVQAGRRVVEQRDAVRNIGALRRVADQWRDDFLGFAAAHGRAQDDAALDRLDQVNQVRGNLDAAMRLANALDA
ncbi:hypothetical protein D3C80_1293110 [compost metagenome]